MFRFFILFCALWVTTSSADTVDKRIDVVAFGSCANQQKAQPIWNDIHAHKPDLFIFGGDNIYGDTQDMNTLRRKYDQLFEKPEFVNFRKNVPILAVWDDHDYGVNDGGKEYSKRAESQQVFLDYFYPNASKERRQREGIYHEMRYEQNGKSLQVLLLDTRYHRSRLQKGRLNREGITGPYVPSKDPSATMLGKEQWEWVEQKLAERADVRIIVSSIQFLNPASGWEAWSTLPHEQTRMLNLLKKNQIENAIFLSGDRHYGEISQMKGADEPTVYDITSSGLTHGSKHGTWERNPYRLGSATQANNYAILKIDWKQQTVDIELHDSQLGLGATHQIHW